MVTLETHCSMHRIQRHCIDPVVRVVCQISSRITFSENKTCSRTVPTGAFSSLTSRTGSLVEVIEHRRIQDRPPSQRATDGGKRDANRSRIFASRARCNGLEICSRASYGSRVIVHGYDYAMNPLAIISEP